MKRAATLLAALAAILTAAAATVRTATENFVTNKIAEAVATIPAPDYSTNNTALVDTIEAKAPAPGNYATVSNRAMTAMQSHQSLWPAVQASTNYTDAAFGVFAETGAVARAAAYGTPTRWTDATGCVWEVEHAPWTMTTPVGLMFEFAYSSNGVMRWASSPGNTLTYSPPGSWAALLLDGEGHFNAPFDATELIDGEFMLQRSGLYVTNLIGRVALTNDIPDMSGYVTPADVTAAIREQSLGGIWDSKLSVWWTPIMQNGALTYETNAVQNAADTLAVVSNVVASGGLASIDAVDAKISTNNAAFVSAVLAVSLTGADAGDLAEIAEYGGYGTVGAAILALIAGLAALKRRVGTAETALAQKASLTDLPYAMVTLSAWEVSSGLPTGITVAGIIDIPEVSQVQVILSNESNALYNVPPGATELTINDLATASEGDYPVNIVLSRLSALQLLDRAGNRVVVSGDTILTLPALVNAGKARDFLVRLEISGSTVPTITFQGQGSEAPNGADEITYETDGDEFPVPDEAGTWLYSFTETAAHKFAVSLKKVNAVTQGGS